MTTLTESDARAAVHTYIKAWNTQDSDLILSVFTPDATYHERVLQPISIKGHEGIRDYWDGKVRKAQADIKCELLDLLVDADRSTAVAEWEVHFTDTVERCRVWMREVAILVFRDKRIESLREYWTSEKSYE